MTHNKRRLTALDLFKFQMVDDPQVAPDGRHVAWVRTWMEPEQNGYCSSIVVTDLHAGSSVTVTQSDGLCTHPRWSPDGRWLAYLTAGAQAPVDEGSPRSSISVVDHGAQLMLVRAGGGDAIQLTNLRGGVRAPVWSPDGHAIAFLTYVDPSIGLELSGDVAPAQDDLYERYNRDVMVVRRLRWKADNVGYLGNYRSHIAVVALAPDQPALQATPQLLTCGEFDLSAPAWSPDSRMLATAGNLNPDGEAVRSSTIYLLDTTAPTPVTPQLLFGLAEMRSTDLRWSPDGAQLAVCGHDDPVIGHYGNQMLWLVDTADGSARCITRHLDRALGDYSRNSDLRRYGGDDGPRWSADGRSILVLVNEAGSVDLWRVEVETGTATALTSGTHSVVAFSTDATGQTIVLLVGDDMNPGDLYRLTQSSSLDEPLRRLTDVNGELLAELNLTEPIRFRARSGEVELDCWMAPPVGREAGVRYPVILYTGGGPGGMRASVFCHEFHLYNAHGYCVVHCNTRGNHGYGEAFSLATRGQWGTLDVEDNMACLQAACERFDFADPERIAVAGGSYGGYMATWIVAHYPQFKAAVVDRCLFNRYSFNGTGDIGFLLDRVEFDNQAPWEAPDVYIERSPMAYVGSIRTPTLVVHSEQDHRCPVEQGEQLYMALKRLGTPTEFVRFPNESHELSRNGRPWHRIFRLERYLDWFARWL